MSQSRPFSAQNADPPRLQGPDENGFTPVPAGGEAAVVAFQAAWLAGRRPNIADFLPRDGACGSDIVTKLAQTDLAHRIEADEAARAEEYLVAWPVLAADRDSALELIEFEYQLRRRREGHLPIDDYCRRFPQFAAQLTARWGGGLAEETHLLRAPSDPIDPGRREPLDNTLPTPAVEAFDSPPVPGRPSTRYCVVRLHAKGGIGEVYVADDGELRREVALKRIQSRFAHDFDCRRRFLLEAEITARLQHPGIVPVYGLVEDADGQPSYAMRFIEGKSFKDAIDEFHRADVALRGDGEHSLALRKLLNRFVEACNAVEYAHSRGVVHRDLKPANIMLGEYGETLVVDWGLAKVMGTQPGPVNREETAARAAASDGESQVPRSGFAAADALGDERTQQGVIVGTPQFMSPEQADGRQDLVGPASDVYSLGATLYSLLAGQPPFANVAFDEMFDRIRYGVFPRPREVRAWVPAALEAVCVKAMSLAPAQRYSSARALADDIEHWLADEPVAAVRDSLAESVARWTRRHRAWTRASIVAGAVVTLVAVVGFVRESNLREAVSDSLRKETAAREAEREAGARADSQRREAQRQARIAVAERLAMQAQMLAEDRPVLSSLLAVEAWMTTAQHGEGPLATAQQVIRRNLTSIGGQPLIGHTGFVTSTAISPDDRWLATGSEDATVRLWDLAAQTSDASIVLRGHEGGVAALAFSRDGRWLASGSRDSTVRLWKLTSDGPSTSVLVLRGHQGLVRSVEFSPDGRWLATGGVDGTARLWDVSAADPGEHSIVLRGHGGVVAQVAFTPDGRRLATASFDGTVRLWDLADDDALGSRYVVLRGNEAAVDAIQVSPDGRWLAALSMDATVRLWDLTGPAIDSSPIELGSGGKVIRGALAFSANGRWLAAAGDMHTVALWDLASTDLAASAVVLRGHESVVTSLTFAGGDRRLISTSFDGTARLWDLAVRDIAAKLPVVLRGHDEGIESAVVSSDGRWLATASHDRTARLWDLAGQLTAAPLFLHGHTDIVGGLNFSPDGRWLVSAAFAGGSDMTPRLWNLTDPSGVATCQPLVGHEGWINDVAMDPKGRWAATASTDRTVRLWRLADDAVERCMVLSGHEASVRDLAFSADGRWLASGAEDKTVRAWDLAAQEPSAGVHVMDGHASGVEFVVFSPDCRWLVTAESDGPVRLWRIAGRESFATSIALRHLGSAPTELAISADNRWLVTASADGAASLCELSADDPAATQVALPGQAVAVSEIAISPNSRWLAAGGTDGSVRLWDLKSGISRAAGRMLSGHEGAVTQLTFSDDGHWLASGSADATVRLHDLTAKDNEASAVVLAGHETEIAEIAFCPDGRQLVTAGAAAMSAHLWDLVTGGPASSHVVLAAHRYPIRSLAVSPNGRWLATGSADSTVGLWQLRGDDLLGTVRTVIGRELTLEERREFVDFTGTTAAPHRPGL